MQSQQPELFGIIHYELYDFREDMKFEISLRRGRKLAKEVTIVVNDYTLAYTLIVLSKKEMIKEKMAALISRKKLRDYYDLYYILRHPILRKYLPKDNLEKF